jgi:hypothetical protein
MKTIFTLALILFCFTCFAQEEKMSYADVVTVEGTPQDVLFDRAYEWIGSANCKIFITDKENGLLTVGGETKYRSKVPSLKESVDGTVIYMVTIIVEDGRYAYEFTNFFHEADVTKPNPVDLGMVTASAHIVQAHINATEAWRMKVMADIQENLNLSIRKTVENMKRTMATDSGSASSKL